MNQGKGELCLYASQVNLPIKNKPFRGRNSISRGHCIALEVPVLDIASAISLEGTVLTDYSKPPQRLRPSSLDVHGRGWGGGLVGQDALSGPAALGGGMIKR